jgi:uncharacterized BrkB/YihY/UPF0761 family membrane protein
VGTGASRRSSEHDAVVADGDENALVEDRSTAEGDEPALAREESSDVVPPGVLRRITEVGRARAERTTAWATEWRARSSLVDTAFSIHERDVEAAGTVLGSAIALRLFLFFVPFLVFVVGLTGFIGGYVDDTAVNDAAGVTGELAAQIRYAFNQPNATRWTALLAGLLGLVLTGRSLARALLVSSSVAWRTGGRVSASVRVLSSVVGLVAAIAFVAAGLNRLRADASVVLLPVSLVGAFVLYVVIWVALMLTLPKGTTDPGAAIPGAVIPAAALTGMQAVSQLYLPERFDEASSLYGGIGVAVVSLGWFFVLGRSVSFAFAVNAVIHEQHGSISRVIFGLPLLRRLPRHWPWFRSYFGLDAPDG